jgi:restriction system protein
MAIPDYQTLMLPLLRLAQDGKEHRIGDAAKQLGQEFSLGEAELNELLPSGRQPTFSNRVHWAKTYLAQAGLLQSTRRSHFKITDRGIEVLRNPPAKISVEFLSQFPEFIEFKTREKQPKASDPLVSAPQAAPFATNDTPDEAIRSTISSLESALASELLQRILNSPPAFFESLIVTLLLSMGYGGSREEAGRAIGKSGDGGIDGVIDQDPLGLDRVYVQAKRYRADLAVSEPEIRAFSGSLGAAKANKGVFVTTSYFTKPAIEFAERHPFKMVLIDAAQLAALMIRHNVGIRIAETVYLKKIDEDFFLDE